MGKFDVQMGLEKLAEAHAAWDEAHAQFKKDWMLVFARLLNDAAVAMMSAEEVARHSGLTVKRVRQIMRDLDMNPKKGKRLLSKQAAETLANNAEIMGIEPHEMDLTSPLAYLPMGEDMKALLETQDRR